MRDVTKLIQMERIESENKFYNQLTSTVTHEMMIPLTCIITFAKSLAKVSNYAVMIINIAMLLKMNLKDLLDRSLIENDKLTPNYEKSCLSDVIEEVN